MLWQRDDCLAPCSILLLLGDASEYVQPGCHHPGATTSSPLIKMCSVAFTQNKLILIYLPRSCQSLKFHSVGVSNFPPSMWLHLQFVICQQQWTGCYSLPSSLRRATITDQFCPSTNASVSDCHSWVLGSGVLIVLPEDLQLKKWLWWCTTETQKEQTVA